jgi:NAD(P)-dependent dehydrogenase (short-subunit alcohol dehydrogenase family)
VRRAIAELGGLHVLVTNVLPPPTVAPLDAQPAAAFGDAFARVQAAVAAMQAALPHLRAAGGGRVINVGHRYGEDVNDGIAAYNAAAWSLVGLTRTAAVDWGQYQIATNVLLPLADTPEFRRYHARRGKLLDLMVGQLPLGSLGDPVEDVGAAALFLAGEACNFINGQVLHGDGGQHVAGPVLNPGKFR